jgi:hypothetical protein
MAEIKEYSQSTVSLPETDEDIIKEFPVWLKAVQKQQRLILVIDGLDKLDDNVH